MNIPCRYGNSCRVSNCKFCHNKVQTKVNDKKLQVCRYEENCKYGDNCWYLHTNKIKNNDDKKQISLKYLIVALNVYECYKCTTCNNSSKYLIAEKGVEDKSQHICETCLITLENNIGEDIKLSEKCLLM